ncbi:MAG: heliorhodopsin HeR [Candidatus Parcubacteria bacterium]|nr:heliorhodopsin HeR [Candidatus Paceibacterota bacterium]
MISNTPKNSDKVIAPIQIRPEDITTKNSTKNLRLWNGVMACLHLGQAITMVALSNGFSQKLFWNLPSPIFTGPTGRRPESIPLAIQDWISIDLGKTVAFFLFLSALAHLITILPKVYPWYLAKLESKMNLIRWYEYAISSSVMILIIALLCGIRDAGILIPLLAINACMNLFGASMEMHNSDLQKYSKVQEISQITRQNGLVVQTKTIEQNSYKPNWSHFIYGCFAGAIPWIVMGIYFYVAFDRLGNIQELPQRFKDVLNTVRFVFPILFVFFNCFALNMYLQYKGVGKWKNYLFGEKVYILLSLVAKSVLAWFIFGGTLR